MVWQIVANREEWNDKTDINEFACIQIASAPHIDYVIIYADGRIDFHEKGWISSFPWSVHCVSVNEQVMKDVIDSINNNY